MSIFAWNWLWRIVFVVGVSAFIAVRWMFPDFHRAAVLAGFTLAGVGLATWLKKLGETRLWCPGCGINTNNKDGEDGYRTPKAIFPRHSCSRCGLDFTIAR